MGILHQSRGKGHAAARTLGGTMSTSRLAKQPEDSAAIKQIHDISQRPQFSGLSGELGGASSEFPIQAKLTIGQPNDKYEQEADRVASQVVQQINAPASVPSSQGMSVQRTEAPEEEEIQAKPENTSLQRMMEGIAGGEASTDLDTAINSARGSGQSLDAGLQRSMGQAMGADFSGVRVHTDGQSDKLNRSIQARAFTTGQDVFFRQGEYNPGSRGGQKLLAHELTHVVQQNGGAVQREHLQRMDGDDKKQVSLPARLSVPLPKYFYHATSKDNAESIARSGLQPRSVGGQTGQYLCMSAKQTGAVTLKNQASDIIFRVETSKLDDPHSWIPKGAGDKEWRSLAGVPGILLEYQRKIGRTPLEKSWRAASSLVSSSSSSSAHQAEKPVQQTSPPSSTQSPTPPS